MNRLPQDSDEIDSAVSGFDPDWLNPASLRSAGLFLAGLLLGWWLLGWWLFPVQWGPASTAHLDAASRADYVQLVATDYARSSDLGKASAYLDDLDGATLGGTLLGLSRRQGAASDDARNLAVALGIDLASPEIVAAETALRIEAESASTTAASPTESTDPGAWNWPRIWYWVSVLALIGAVMAALLLAWSWWRWQSRKRAQRGPGAALGRTRTPEVIPVPQSEGVQGETRGAGRSAPIEAGPTDSLQATQALPQVSMSRGETRSRPRSTEPRSSSSAPSWQPERIEIGQTVDARYHAAEQRSIHTWLVHQPRGALVGGAGLLAQSIGGVNTVDLWFSDRDDVDQTSRTPTVTFVTQTAYDDPVLRARLSDRRLVAAVPGKIADLETVDLRLNVEVVAVEPGPESGRPSIDALVLALTPLAQPGTGLHRAVAEESRFEDGQAEVSEERSADWDQDLDREVDDAFDPPRPLSFRRDE